MPIDRKPDWITGKVEILPDCQEVQGAYLAQRDWRLDKKGYFLFRIDRTNKLLEAAFCPHVNKIAFIFRGKRPEDIYHEVAKRDLLEKKDHYSYLGLELNKMHMALTFGWNYIQDEDLDNA